jgi:hypothetical protein
MIDRFVDDGCDGFLYGDSRHPTGKKARRVFPVPRSGRRAFSRPLRQSFEKSLAACFF